MTDEMLKKLQELDKLLKECIKDLNKDKLDFEAWVRYNTDKRTK